MHLMFAQCKKTTKIQNKQAERLKNCKRRPEVGRLRSVGLMVNRLDG